MAFAAANLGGFLENLQAVQKNPTVRYLTIAAIVLEVVVFFWWINKVYKQALKAAQSKSDKTIGSENSDS